VGASPTAVWTGSAGGMALAISTPPFGGASSLPRVVQAGTKAWTATGTTDTLTLTLLGAGTYVLQLAWAMASAPPALLTVPPPTAGATTVAVVAGGSVPATSLYSYSLIQLT
jgi:hypothetical protein